MNINRSFSLQIFPIQTSSKLCSDFRHLIFIKMYQNHIKSFGKERKQHPWGAAHSPEILAALCFGVKILQVEVIGLLENFPPLNFSEFNCLIYTHTPQSKASSTCGNVLPLCEQSLGFAKRELSRAMV